MKTDSAFNGSQGTKREQELADFNATPSKNGLQNNDQ